MNSDSDCSVSSFFSSLDSDDVSVSSEDSNSSMDYVVNEKKVKNINEGTSTLHDQQLCAVQLENDLTIGNDTHTHCGFESKTFKPMVDECHIKEPDCGFGVPSSPPGNWLPDQLTAFIDCDPCHIFHIGRFTYITDDLIDKCFISALLLCFKFMHNISTYSLESILTLIRCFNPTMPIPSSVKSSLTILKKHVFNVDNFYVKEHDIIYLNVKIQLQVILNRQFDTILQYQQKLRSDLKSKLGQDMLSNLPGHKECLNMSNGHCDCNEVCKFLTIHFILSSDGTNLYHFKNLSFWPIYLMIVDLPLHIRQKSENIIIYALSKGKPNWKYCFRKLKEILNAQYTLTLMPKIIDKNVTQCTSHNPKLTIHVRNEVICVICDLPALCSITNCTQFNGKFGCPKCTHPGKSSNSRTIYPFVSSERKRQSLLRTDCDHLLNVTAAQISGSRVFGVKGESFLKHIISIPSGIVIDPMHCLFEGVTKQYLKLFFDQSNRYFPMYMGRPNALHLLSHHLSRILVPHDFPKFPDFIKHFEASTTANRSSIQASTGFLKAHDLKNLLLYPLFLIMCDVIPITYVLHFGLLVYSIRTSFSSNLNAEKIGIISMCLTFFQKLLSKLNYPDHFYTINLHLLTHFADQLKQYGPAYTVSMFAFESENKLIKHFCHGTVAHDSQMVRAILLKNVLLNFLCSALHLSKFSCFKEIVSSFMHCGINPIGCDISTLDDYRVKVNGIVFHSKIYPKKKSSVSYLFANKNDQYGEIIAFINNEGSIYVHAKLYECHSLLDFITQQMQCLNEPYVAQIYDKLKLLDNKLQFQIVDTFTSEEVIFPASDLVCRCMIIPFTLLSRSYSCIVPCIDIFEKQ